MFKSSNYTRVLNNNQILKFISKNEGETRKIAKKLMKNLSPESNIFCLYGELGSGKTKFVQGIGEYLKIPQRELKSPTYVICHEHENIQGIKLYHYDLYRLQNPEELEDIGIVEVMNENEKNIIAIEWPEIFKKQLPSNRIDIYFKFIDEQTRELKVYLK